MSAYASNARLPLSNVAVSITSSDGTVIALRLTNSNGQIVPVEIPVPDLSASQTPNPAEIPFATVNLFARASGYEQIEVENLQVFPGITTNQNLRMIPLSELPSSWDQTELFNIPAQNL